MTPKRIILHHSLTKDGPTVSWQAIRRYHTDPNGPYKMIDIGYHFGIEQVNTEYEILVGRQLDQVGAHTRGENDDSIGICVVGNYDIQDVPEPAYKKLLALVDSLTTLFNITSQDIHRHKEYAPYKSCPGTRFPYQRLLNDLIKRT